jgi:hypothetical protein
MATPVALLSVVDLAALDRVTGGGSFWEPASTWDPKQGRFVSTDDYKESHGVDRVCRRASCWDSSSGHFISGDDWNRLEEDRGRDR